MKKKRIVILLIPLFVLISACAHQTGRAVKAPPGPVLHSILKKGELAVGTSGNQPPLNMRTKKGEIIGLEVDLARSMAAEMGVTLKLVSMPFSELLPALEAGQIHMILSGMTITSRRNLKVAFVGPYFVSGKGILTKKQVIASMKDSSEMDSPYTTLAALRGSTSQLFVEKRLPRAKLVTTKNYDEAVDLLIQEKVDAFIADYPICLYSLLRHPNEGLAALVAPGTFEPIGIALPPNDPLLVNWMENFLSILEGSGELEKLKNRWFNNPAWLNRLP